jgi:hypothetical protein
MSENEKQWFVDMQNEIVGPVPLEMLRDWLRVQTITSETWVRRDDSNEWHPLVMIEEFGLSEGEIRDIEELADQPAAHLPLHDLRADMKEPQLTDRDRLLNRAFAIACLANVILLLGVLVIVVGTFKDSHDGHISPIAGLLLGFIVFIPVMTLYYTVNSISVALKSSAELREKVEQLQKMLEASTSKQ